MIGEIDPRFAGKQAPVTYARDDQPMKDRIFRLVVPGDAHGGRPANDLAPLAINQADCNVFSAGRKHIMK